MFRYRIKSTGKSSSWFGPCEVCKKHCTESFIQVEEKKVDYPNHSFFTTHGCKTLFGHNKCLKESRR